MKQNNMVPYGWICLIIGAIILYNCSGKDENVNQEKYEIISANFYQADRGNRFEIDFDKPLPRDDYYYLIKFKTKNGHTIKGQTKDILTTTNFMFDPGPRYTITFGNHFYNMRHISESDKVIMNSLIPGNIEETYIQIFKGYKGESLLTKAIFKDLDRSKDKPKETIVLSDVQEENALSDNTVSYTVYFNDGRRLDLEEVWEENDQIKSKMYGTVVSYPKSAINRIEKK